MTGSHFDKLMAVLDRQSDDKLNPNLLIGYLGLINLMSIMSVVHSSMGAGGGFELPLNTGNLTPQTVGDDNNLVNTLTSLMSKAGGSGGGAGGPDLSGLLGMLGGGNKKMNPQLLLTLMNLMNNMKNKTEGNGDVKEVETEKSPPIKVSQPETKGEKKRLL